MKSQSLKQMEKKEEKKKEVHGEKEKGAEQGERAPSLKKWKGKDWYNILAPEMFGESILFETPGIDPKVIIGRVIDIPVPILTGDRSKQHMTLKFKVFDVKEKNAHTKFHGYVCNRDFISRFIREGLQKLDAIEYVTTNDGWKLQVTITVILNGDVEVNIVKKVRKLLGDSIKEEAGNSDITGFIKSVISSTCQKKMRKDGSKIYPIRFSEIAKIEVKKAGSDAVATNQPMPAE